MAKVAAKKADLKKEAGKENGIAWKIDLQDRTARMRRRIGIESRGTAHPHKPAAKPLAQDHHPEV